MAPRILTITLNPTVDVAADAPAVQPVRKIRTTNESFDPGGGGVNVSRVLQALGGETLALVLAGGVTGHLLAELLTEAGLPHRAIPIHGRTRMSHTVHDLAAGLEYRFVPEGPALEAGEWQAALAALENEAADWVVGSGSLPPGAPAEFYARAARIAAGRGQRFVLDTSGAPLRAALDAGGAGPIALIKPSRGEFAALIGRPLEAPGALEEAALALVRQGGVGLVAVTLGHEGALLAETAGVLRLPALEVPALGAVGAGDSFLAAMVLALTRGEAPREAFAWGMAAGAAAVMRPGTAHPRREDVVALRQRIGPL
ncbi:1-phosphofructokinase family hexose kinase [Paeniroseomonas aquatica]|uniref:Phosphofructokinase n=1 Tax=Paeniroseomonas aquatica TaxID=373043 RepID=A0ABT8A2A0_9PROT|nr:1-phosphofructokinase family hexose kinase [Paeniroseomonas aquatica]MDN3563809.1 1-phosphofructokinase family hexose kinase [Paeniroseomonas aquatica]